MREMIKIYMVNIKKIFLLLLGKAFEKYGPEIEKNQQVLLSLSDLAIEAYLSESTLKRTIKNINRGSIEDQFDQINMTKLYIYEACQIVLKKSSDVVNSIIDLKSQDEIYSSITSKLKYSENPNVFELKTKIAEKIISENFSDKFWTGSAKHLQIFNRARNNSSKLNANSKKKILQKVKEIFEELSQFRFKEGSVLEKDLLNNINSIYINLERINKRAIKRKNQIRTKLQNKILTLKEFDKERFEQEIIYYIEKYDINEELIRLDSHLNLFQKNINSVSYTHLTLPTKRIV